jgi:dienelactone hydrolase
MSKVHKNNYRALFITIILIGSLIISGCAPTNQAPTPVLEEDPTIVPTEVVEAVVEDTPTIAPTEIIEEEQEPPQPTATDEVVVVQETDVPSEVNALPPDPIAQTFQTLDGVNLEGMFYPAAMTNAPIIVLMHWAPGDQHDWSAIAPWLQNRGYQSDLPEGGLTWLDPTWFPSLGDDLSFNVFTFTFRGCEGGCANFDREGWLQDVEAVMTHITDLEAADLSRVMTIGASIGADGAAFGCHFYNNQTEGCQGALSLSPGGYLTFPYSVEVADLESETPPKPAWCLFSTEDLPSANACSDITGALYQSFEYPDFSHGMELIHPDQEPNPLDLIFQFIEQYLN